ncbi:shikimate dehydrogenase [Angustibacter luteus]|uniref:Shikimate dehydrogenase (NADP(+)) n=1 Tax=Angustibacter luteus TaxID=658456 RepID=A0ABW1JH28_9ACTN
MTRRFLAGLIGSGVGPSLTPALHMNEADAQGMSYVYRTIDLGTVSLDPDDVGDLVRYARALGFDGLNITHPCKQVVIEHLDLLDDRARELGAVNTVVFGEQGAIGYNTDWSGFTRAMTRGLPDVDLDRVVLLGAGGAGASVGHALLALGVQELVVVDLSRDRADALVHMLGELFGVDRCSASDVDAIAVLNEKVDGYVHCTPTGMAEHPGTPFDVALLQRRQWVADIVYRPLETALVAAARERGCPTLDGGGMAVYQAVDAFELITGTPADDERMLRDFARLTAS